LAIENNNLYLALSFFDSLDRLLREGYHFIQIMEISLGNQKEDAHCLVMWFKSVETEPFHWKMLINKIKGSSHHLKKEKAA
jgi:hypothetical protein